MRYLHHVKGWVEPKTIDLALYWSGDSLEIAITLDIEFFTRIGRSFGSASFSDLFLQNLDNEFVVDLLRLSKELYLSYIHDKQSTPKAVRVNILHLEPGNTLCIGEMSYE